jgi:hypothetical protein
MQGKPAVVMTLPVDPRLKELIGQAADESNMPMNEWVAKVTAEHLGRPDLARVPRKAYGRPRAKAGV